MWLKHLCVAPMLRLVPAAGPRAASVVPPGGEGCGRSRGARAPPGPSTARPAPTPGPPWATGPASTTPTTGATSGPWAAASASRACPRSAPTSCSRPFSWLPANSPTTINFNGNYGGLPVQPGPDRRLVHLHRQRRRGQQRDRRGQPALRRAHRRDHPPLRRDARPAGDDLHPAEQHAESRQRDQPDRRPAHPPGRSQQERRRPARHRYPVDHRSSVRFSLQTFEVAGGTVTLGTSMDFSNSLFQVDPGSSLDLADGAAVKVGSLSGSGTVDLEGTGAAGDQTSPDGVHPGR